MSVDAQGRRYEVPLNPSLQSSPADDACHHLQVATLTEELENSRGGVRDQLKEKDAKINSLIEELGNSQAMLNDKVAELAEVLPFLYQYLPCSDLVAETKGDHRCPG